MTILQLKPKDNLIDHLTDEEYMRAAIKQIGKRRKGEFPIGSVVVYKGKIVGKATPRDKTTNKFLAHAEVLALKQAAKKIGKEKLHHCIIYSTAEPCKLCAAAIFEARIEHIVFGAHRANLPLREHGISFKDLVADAGYAIDVIGGLLEEEILTIFNEETFKKGPHITIAEKVA